MLRKALYAVVALAFIAAPIATEAIASIPNQADILDIHKAVAPDLHPDAIYLKQVSVVTTDMKTGAKRCYSFTVAKKLELAHSSSVPYPLRC